MTSPQVARFPTRATSHRAAFALPPKIGKASARGMTARSRTGKKGSWGAAQAKAKVTLQRYEQPYAAQARATTGTDNARHEACHKQLIVGAAWKEKHVVPVEGNPRLTGFREAEVVKCRFWVRWRHAVQGALSAVWRATQARSGAAMRPLMLQIVRPQVGYWLYSTLFVAKTKFHPPASTLKFFRDCRKHAT